MMAILEHQIMAFVLRKIKKVYEVYENGECIFEYDDFVVPGINSTVMTVIVDGSRSNGKIYDLMGREVKNPQPRTIYISNGKKWILP